jgi:DNA uptake protein ComE-like DNA-binding protein
MNVHGKHYFLTLSAIALTTLVTACNNPPPSDQHLQDQAAKATEEAKQQSKEALAQARVAAANAERAVDDVAAGVKQGLNTKTPTTDGRVDLNGASEADLAALPGISVAKAKQIVDHRPYGSTHDLVKDGLISEQHFDELAPKITVH